jgi:hypothetical protein
MKRVVTLSKVHQLCDTTDKLKKDNFIGDDTRPMNPIKFVGHVTSQ